MQKNLVDSGFFTLLKFQLKGVFSSISDLMSPIYFSLLSIVLFSICIGPYKISETIVIGITFAILCLSILFFSSNLLGFGKSDGVLQNIYLSGVKPEVIILSKLSVLTICTYIVSLVNIALAFILLRFEGATILWVLINTLVFVPAIASVLLFVNLISILLPNKIVQFLLAMPLLVPCMILATKGVEEHTFTIMMLGASFIYLPLFVYGSTKLLPHAASA